MVGRFAEEKDLELAFSVYSHGETAECAELAADVMRRIKAKMALINNKTVDYSDKLDLCSVPPINELTFVPDKEYLMAMSHEELSQIRVTHVLYD